MLKLHKTTALSTLDGMYTSITEPLRPLFAEYSLFHYASLIELEWMGVLIETRHISQKLSFSQQQILRKIQNKISPKTYQELNQFTDSPLQYHYIDSVKNFLQTEIQENPDLPSDLAQYVHYQIAETDVEQLTLCVILNEFQKQFFMPKIDEVQNNIRRFALQLKNSTKNKKHSRVVPLLARYIAPLEQIQRLIDGTQLKIAYQGHIDSNDPSIKAAWTKHFTQKYHVRFLSNKKNNSLKNSLKDYARSVVMLNEKLMDFCERIAQGIKTKLMQNDHYLAHLYDRMMREFSIANLTFKTFYDPSFLEVTHQKTIQFSDFLEDVATPLTQTYLAQELCIDWIQQLLEGGFEELILDSKFEEGDEPEPQNETSGKEQQELDDLEADSDLLIQAVIEKLDFSFTPKQTKQAKEHFSRYLKQKNRSAKSDLEAAFLSVITTQVVSASMPHQLFEESNPFGFSDLDLQRLAQKKSKTKIKSLVNLIKNAQFSENTQGYLSSVSKKYKF